MGIVSLVSLILALGCLGFFIYKAVKLTKNHEIGQESYKLEGKDLKILASLAAATGVLLALSAMFLSLFKQYSLKFFETVAVVIGPIFVGIGLCVGLLSFTLFYYKLDLDQKQKNFFKYGFPLGFIGVFLGLFLFSTGIAAHISYPLVNGFSTGEGLTYPNESSSGFGVKFYGILIVSGALLCYGITDHMMYQKYKKHGLIDTLFIVAFLFGILGARLWYCFVLEPEYFLANPGQIIVGIVSGGLAIQGGALLGIIAGVSFVLLFRKYMDVRYVMDVAIPTILLAQAIGRMGNFFNQEVFGAVTTYENLWFMPTILRKNMLIDGSYRVPLFFIEALMNIGGYFLIRYLLGKVCKFNFGLGYQAAAYIAWYGIVRIVLELFRDSEFKYMQSWYTAFAFLGGGLLLMLAFYLLHRFRMNKGKEDKFGEKI